MGDTGQHHRVDTPADEGVDQPGLFLDAVMGLAQQQLVAAVTQDAGQRLDGVRENRMGDHRNQASDDAGTAGRQAARRQVGQVTQLRHRGPHGRQRGRRHLVRRVDGPGHGDQRHAGRMGHIAHARCGPGSCGQAAAVGMGAGGHGWETGRGGKKQEEAGSSGKNREKAVKVGENDCLQAMDTHPEMEWMHRSGRSMPGAWGFCRSRNYAHGIGSASIPTLPQIF